MSSQADTGILKEGQLASNLPAADQLIDNFIQPLGGVTTLEKSSPRVESGSSQVGGKSIRVELFDQGPDKRLFIQHTPAGDSMTAVDGNTVWASVPGRPTNDLSRSDLEAARMDADLQFALHIQQLFP